jgi:hypothetical protein
MSALFDACLEGYFPDLGTLVDYGLDGRDGVNPVALFERYCEVVRANLITPEALHHAMVTDTLSTVVGIKIKSGYNKRDDAIFNY